ncbi:MAG: glycosyltransferase family 1 protein [Heliobacteriaceae bacterium]|nr:glycosyltransferase family 1 protein [Heliobacteriaceae bacterium]MDD4587319.1 glycosyltransferase family 1 protein [Heliobacteriaceae bacterium]
MKVGIDSRAAIWYHGTGIGTYVYQLCRHLHNLAAGNKIRFFWPGDEFRKLNIWQLEVFRSVEKNKDKFWEEVHIPNIIRNEGIDVYHVPQNGIGLPQQKPCPFIATVHDLIPYIMPETVGKGYLKIFIEEMPRILAMVDRVIVPSQGTARDLVQIAGVPSQKITVIYEAAEPIYRPLDKSLALQFVKEKYGINTPYVLYVGGFSPRKNLRLLIQAFHQITRQLPEQYSLVLPGKPAKEFSDLEVLVSTRNLQDKVHFIGFVEVAEMPLIYNGASAFVYPSFYEGFGLPPIEAMACGIPTLVANTAALPEVVGDGALLFSPVNVNQLSELLFMVLTDQNFAQCLAAKGIKQAKKYTWTEAARQTWAVYHQVWEQT